MPSAELARMFVQAGQQVTRQPGFKISREALSPDGLTYKFFGISGGRNTFMLTAYSAAEASLFYYICNLN